MHDTQWWQGNRRQENTAKMHWLYPRLGCALSEKQRLVRRPISFCVFFLLCCVQTFAWWHSSAKYCHHRPIPVLGSICGKILSQLVIVRTKKKTVVKVISELKSISRLKNFAKTGPRQPTTPVSDYSSGCGGDEKLSAAETQVQSVNTK